MKNNTLKYFYEIMNVPRKSGKETKIINYLINFAKLNNLLYFKDDFNNLIIYKNKNLNNKIILQAHVDVVCESVCDFDFENNGLTKIIEGDFLKAKGTTLGADNGVGVAMILSLLQEDLPISIEAVFTSEEETTMNGAKKLNYSKLSSNNLLSFDGDNDSVIEISSAGFVKAKVNFNITKQKNKGYKYKAVLTNFAGGHSGIDIDKNRENAIVHAINFITKNNFKLLYLHCENKDNVIPNHCEFEFTSDKKLNLEQFVLNLENEPYAKLKIEYVGFDLFESINQSFIEFLLSFPNGVLSRYQDGFAKTSVNISSIDTSNNIMYFSLRSSNLTDQKAFINKLSNLCANSGNLLTVMSSSPFFESNTNSQLIQDLSKSYQKLFNAKPSLNRVHAGLEGGVFAQKIKNLNIAVIGVNIYDMHTVNERVSLLSIEKVYNWVYNFLKNYDK